MNVIGCDADDEDITYVQYTGLRDKNGNQIYEGDIIRYDNPNAGYRDKTQEDYLEKAINSIEDFYEDDYLVSICKSGEIVGNIHEGQQK